MRINLKFLLFSLGVIIISLVFWNRFIRVRKDIDIVSIDSDIRILFISMSIILFGYIFITNLLQVLDIKLRENSFISNLLNKELIIKLQNYFKRAIESPLIVLEFIYEIFPIRIFVERYATLIPYYIEKHFLVYYILLIIIPRSLIVITLFIDVVIFQQIHFINKIIFVAIVPLIIQTIFHIIKYCALRTIEYLNRFFEFIYDDDDNTYDLYYKKLTNKDDMETQNKADTEYVTALFCIHTSHISAIERFYAIFDKYQSYYRCYTSAILFLTSISQLLIILKIDYFFLFNLYLYLEEPFSGLFL